MQLITSLRVNMLQYKIFIVLLLCVTTLGLERPTVELPLGKIEGHHKLSYGNRIFSAFEGIPYAKPPLGDLRFEEPQKAEPWFGVWNATVLHECIQLHLLTPNPQVTGNEDCLYINIYVPKKKLLLNESLNVVVHIHGGAFITGSGGSSGPEYLMDRDIIYINFNYRLGPLGFLSTEDEIVPGNNGLKDQVLALKWIQDNVKYFGGNPNSVTLLGLSAGAVSVHYHYLSSLSKGLFHRGMSQSGTVLNPWAIQKAALEKARKLASAIGCDQASTKEFIYCMRQQPASDIVQNMYTLAAYPIIQISIFAPVVEKENENAFLTENPYKLLKNGRVHDVPWITTTTTEEGIFPSLFFYKRLDEINERWSEMMPDLLEYTYTVPDVNKSAVGEKIRAFYFGKENISLDTYPELIELFGDRHFHIDFEKAARMQAKVTRSPVYSMLYGYRGDESIGGMLGLNYGVCHGDDGLLLYYYMPLPESNTKRKLSNSDEAVKEILLDIVTSFAENDKPKVKSVDWQPVANSPDFGYLFIHDSEQINMAFRDEIAPQEFWRSLGILENENIVVRKDEL